MKVLRAIWNWLAEPFREDPLDVPINLADMHELSGGRLPEPK
jgi:hypothetical protein